MNKQLATLLLIVITSVTYGQTNRYVVFFTDKGGSDIVYSLDSPQEFLTQKALDRRSKQLIPLDSTDLPVHEAYVDDLKGLGISVYFTSRWMNAAILQTEESNIPTIESQVFVDSVALIAENERLVTDKIEVETPTTFEAPLTTSSNTDLQLSMLQANLMHNDGITGEGMTIAVLDDGFVGVNQFQPFQHLWENDRIVGSKDFVENTGNVFRLGDHGTSVLSTIAARFGDNVKGTAYDANFILCITEEGGSEDRVEEFNWLLGAEYADSLGADVINSSLGYRTFDIPEHDYTYEDLDGATTIVSRAAKLAADKGIIVVVSAGNSGDNIDATRRYVSAPGDADGILTVASVNPDFTRTSFSSVGPSFDGRMKPDVAALGLATTVTNGAGRITRANGTSFASPLIAGLAAGIWQANPQWDSQEVMEAMKAAGHNASRPDSLLGFGVPFYSYAVEGKVLNVSDIIDERIAVYPNPFHGDKLYLRFSDPLRGKWQLDITNAEGKTILTDSYKATRREKILEFDIENLEKGVYFLILRSNKQRKAVKLLKF
ncbi:MAG: S8 family serine peptidase [Bacteroidota bacterium]